MVVALTYVRTNVLSKHRTIEHNVICLLQVRYQRICIRSALLNSMIGFGWKLTEEEGGGGFAELHAPEYAKVG